MSSMSGYGISSTARLRCVHFVFLNVLLLCLSTWVSLGVAISDQCRLYLQYVAETNSAFEVCALLDARPFTVCTSCYENYALAYNTFVNLKNGRGQVAKNCSEDLVSGDRVSIINRAFNYLTDTWISGNCDNCLVVTKEDNQLSFQIAESTKEFQYRRQRVTECIDSHLRNQSTVCLDCQSTFLNLSESYNQLVNKYQNKLCMDIIDAMNETRVEWSEYGCSQMYYINLEVCLYAGAMVTITIIFYVVARYSQKPREAEILEERTLRHHVSKMSVGSNAFHTNSCDQQNLIPAGYRQRPAPVIAS
ncbi:osteopetrosis-associated transmembrane protein 1-like [Tropilaelaps mercedesae]|uniref:Osteopetrosis-associated transmembrane protein 1-like n=1 Tax=Tropilaelaps mercedesae TaxID=418985 RepID=A0A1V9XZI5_9ACAR|nr:osteopetrosis-associated transmembrane protein 1-like [Tropilaelaps mercedesae]